MAAARALLLVKTWSRIKTHAVKDFIQTGAQLFFYLSGLEGSGWRVLAAYNET